MSRNGWGRQIPPAKLREIAREGREVTEIASDIREEAEAALEAIRALGGTIRNAKEAPHGDHFRGKILAMEAQMNRAVSAIGQVIVLTGGVDKWRNK